VVGDDDRTAAIALQLELGGSVIASVAAEQAVGWFEPVAVGRGHHGGWVRQVLTEHREPLHVGVRVEEGGADLEQPLLERAGAGGK
jgi:hypothetical protein